MDLQYAQPSAQGQCSTASWALRRISEAICVVTSTSRATEHTRHGTYHDRILAPRHRSYRTRRKTQAYAHHRQRDRRHALPPTLPRRLLPPRRDDLVLLLNGLALRPQLRRHRKLVHPCVTRRVDRFDVSTSTTSKMRLFLDQRGSLGSVCGVAHT